MSDTFKDRLQELLIEHDMKAADLANNIDATKSRISQWMHGKTNPNAESLYKLSKLFNVSEAWLMGYDVPKKENRQELEQKVEVCDIVEKCFGIQARDVVLKLLNLNDAGLLAANKYIDFLVEQPEYTKQQKGEESQSVKAM